MASRMMGCLAFRGWARGSMLLVVGRSAPTSHPCRWNQRTGAGCRWRARAQTETDSRRHRQTPPFEKLRWECTRKFVHKLFHQASGPPNPRKLKKTQLIDEILLPHRRRPGPHMFVQLRLGGPGRGPALFVQLRAPHYCATATKGPAGGVTGSGPHLGATITTRPGPGPAFFDRRSQIQAVVQDFVHRPSELFCFQSDLNEHRWFQVGNT